MKLYQKILGIFNTALLAVIFILSVLTVQLKNYQLVEITFFILFPLLLIMTIVFMFSYKNSVLRKVFLFGMPFFLCLLFIADMFRFPLVFTYLIFCLIGYVVLVNLILHFLRYDLNFIVVTFLLIIGLLFKRNHMAGGGLIISLSSVLLCILSLTVSFRAFRIKDNRYLSILIFACSLILAVLSTSFLFKIQHWPGAGLMIGISIPGLIIATLIILLTLPGSNFIEWTSEQKKILLRGLLIPWLFFIYTLITTSLIQPYNQFKPFFFLDRKHSEVKFNMDDYKVNNKNGLELDDKN
jgi:hypothetical protein